MNKLLLTASLIFICSITSYAQMKTLKWDTELCAVEGNYDSSKYSQTELLNTQKLVSSIGSISLFTDATAQNPSGINKLSLAKLDSEYNERSRKLKNLDIVDTPFFERLRQRKLTEMDQWYRLSRATIQAYRDPARLKDFKQAEFCLDFYAEPLIRGGEYLYATWLKVNMDSRTRNASPQRLQAIFDSQNRSADRLSFARVEVMRFGWWNCAIRSVDQIDAQKEYVDIQKNFRALFTDLKEECDEP